MLMAMSHAEKWLPHTKSGHFLKKWRSRADSGSFENGRRALTLDIFKKSQVFCLKPYGRPDETKQQSRSNFP